MENREWRMAGAPFHLPSSIIHLRLIIGVTFGWFFFSNQWKRSACITGAATTKSK
jgi:hypothetical protein